MSNSLDPIISVGLDVAKDNFEAAVIATGQERAAYLSAKPFDRSPQGVQALIQAIEASDAMKALVGAKVRVVMEATGAYSRQLTEWLIAARPVWAVAIVNPAFIKGYSQSLGVRNKTDRADPRPIAQFGLERNPTPYQPLPEVLKRLRALSRERDAIVRQVVETKNRTQETTDAPKEVKKAQKTILAMLERQRDRIEEKMVQTLQSDPEWLEEFERLQSVPGVGPITAMVVLAELGDLRRFNRARQLSAMAGTNPRITESGTSVRRQTRLCKMGSRRVRQALYLSAMTAIRKPGNELYNTYHRLLKHGKAKMVALCAVMRKQLLVMRSMMIHQTRFGEVACCQELVEKLLDACGKPVENAG